MLIDGAVNVGERYLCEYEASKQGTSRGSLLNVRLIDTDTGDEYLNTQTLTENDLKDTESVIREALQVISDTGLLRDEKVETRLYSYIL